jgi:hypothetical protein
MSASLMGGGLRRGVLLQQQAQALRRFAAGASVVAALGIVPGAAGQTVNPTPHAVTAHAGPTHASTHDEASHRHILVGHSLGADAVVLMAQQLNAQGVPVALVVPFDGTESYAAPANVGCVVNLTQRKYSYVQAGLGFHGKLSNVDVSSDTTIDHVTIDKSPRLQAMALKEILQAAHGQSCRPGTNAPAVARAKQSAPKEIVPQDNGSKENAIKDSATKDSTTKDSAPREALPTNNTAPAKNLFPAKTASPDKSAKSVPSAETASPAKGAAKSGAAPPRAGQ